MFYPIPSQPIDLLSPNPDAVSESFSSWYSKNQLSHNPIVIEDDIYIESLSYRDTVNKY